MSDTFKTTEVLIGDSGATSDGSTKTGTAERCEKKFQYQYVRQVYVPRAKNPKHFSVGAIFGATRAAWFTTKFATNKKAWLYIRHAAQREAERQRLPVDPKDEAYAIALFEMYMEHWLKFPLPRPKAVEYKVGPHPKLLLTGSLDDLSEYPQSAYALAIGECKTTAGDIATSIKEYEFHTQTLQYQALYLLGHYGNDKHPYGPVAGTVLDITKKPEGKKKAAFHREFIEIPRQAVVTFIRTNSVRMARVAKMTWDDEALRSYQCTYQAGRARVDCEYKKLCMHGASATGGYVLGDSGKSLRSHKPKDGQRKMPWE